MHFLLRLSCASIERTLIRFRCECSRIGVPDRAIKKVKMARRSINLRDRSVLAKPAERSAFRFRRLARLFCLVVVAACTGQGRIAAAGPLLAAVDSIRVTVSDADVSAAFYSGVLSFHKISDVEIAGSNVERLEGVFGSRVRSVRMKLGN